jgi:hypothetical protein
VDAEFNFNISNMGERIPTFARNGIPLEKVNPQPDIQKNAETANDWEYKEAAKYLYRMANIFKDRLIDPILHTDRKRLPDPVISFENLRNHNTLAAYTLARNPQGLLFEITMNTQHYVDNTKNPNQKVWQFGKWAQLETLLHEQIHLWQQNFGKHPTDKRKNTCTCLYLGSTGGYGQICINM